MSQGFKQQMTFMNNAVFPTSLLPHLCDPPTLRAGLAVAEEAQLLALTQGSHQLHKCFSQHMCFADGACCLPDELWAG